jgi:NAD(P)-dependent dehydrogenase (short-subunit alcohol dehydrogenase family)
MNETTNLPLSGKTALITGASGGIGAAVAGALSRSGASVCLVSRSGLGPGLPNSLTVAADVRDREAMWCAAERTAEHFGGIDIVVGNAGVGSWAPFIETPDNDIQEMTDVNVTGLFNTVSAALPYLKKKRSRGHRHSCIRSRPPRAARRSSLRCHKVRSSGIHTLIGPRTQGQRHPVHQYLPGRSRE